MSMNFSFFVVTTGAETGAETGTTTVAPVSLLWVNIVPNPILERVSCDSKVRRYAG